MITVDLNCDMGEGVGNDSEIMPFISSANIACGFHAGDYATIAKTTQLALQHGVAIGAHPSFPDRQNFGRTVMSFSPRHVHEMVLYQIGAVDAIVKNLGGKLRHVKPHGALYNQAAIDNAMARAIAVAVKEFDSKLVLFGLANSALIDAANEIGLACKHEAFGDRTYQDDGTLTSRQHPNALITNDEDCLRQVLQMVKEGTVTTLSGKVLSLKIDTICLHGDGDHAVEFAKMIYTKLRLEGIKIGAQ